MIVQLEHINLIKHSKIISTPIERKQSCERKRLFVFWRFLARRVLRRRRQRLLASPFRSKELLVNETRKIHLNLKDHCYKLKRD